ncbi:uncharacterized protein [Temnothorax nylanderi]|uniref:uncharacterized protein n=1 Tax=Temnothorax nylanderi TaxID=102681 RepID=UPI003A8B0B54
MADEMRALVQRRATIKAQLTRFKGYLEKWSDRPDEQQLIERFEKFKTTWDSFDEVQISIELNATVTGTQSDDNERAGNYEAWMGFYDNFKSIVHDNANLTPVQKLQYLRSSLTDEAAQVIQSLETSSQNYEVAWALVVERYDNRRIIIQSHIRALFDLPMTRDTRFAKVESMGLCYNCLRPNHLVDECKSGTCRKCKRKHHTLLHSEGVSFDRGSGSSNAANANPIASLQAVVASQVLLATASVHMLNDRGEPVKCTVLLDNGSQSNFVTEKLCNTLNLAKREVSIPVSGFNQSLTHIKHSITTTLQSRDGRFATELSFLVVPRITETLPAQTINRCDLNLPRNITLADPEFCTPSEIDALIGAELFYHLLCVGQIRLGNSALILQKTRLGWIASGVIHDKGPASKRIACNLVVDSLDAQVAKFWELEEVSSVRRLAQDPQLREEYTNFLDEYERLGHMTEIPVSDVTEEGYFIPHHPVFKRDSHTTKLRVVFNASSKSSTGVSLNDVLLAGPTLQEDLFSIVTRFRTHRYVRSADIEKMYRQVKVYPEDGKYQMIVWRKSPKDPIKIYILNTATYGTVPASFLVVRSLLQLSEDERKCFPLARRVLLEDFYMDDALTGASKLDQA